MEVKKRPILGLALMTVGVLGLAYLRGGREHFWLGLKDTTVRFGVILGAVFAFVLVLKLLVHFKIIDLSKVEQENKKRERIRERVFKQPRAAVAMALALIAVIAPMLLTTLIFSLPLPQKNHVWALDYLLIEKAKFLLGAILTVAAVVSVVVGRRWARNTVARRMNVFAAILSIALFWVYLEFAREPNLVLVAFDLGMMMTLVQFPALYLHRLYWEIGQQIS